MYFHAESMKYNPGTHIIATLYTTEAALLSSYVPVQQLLDELIHQFSLQKLGEVYHNFPTGGFTAVICLSESHISLHTWPEHKMINLDIYLSNFQRNNDGTVDQLFSELVRFFEATIHQQQIITR